MAMEGYLLYDLLSEIAVGVYLNNIGEHGVY
jgi:hypothetical protein